MLQPVNKDELLARLSQRDPAALEALMKIYFPLLCRFAEKILADASPVKDIVQDTFINYWKSDHQFAALDNLKAFLLVSTKNGCLNYLRGRERQEKTHRAATAETPLETDSIETDIVTNELLALIYETVAQMTPAMQEIFYLSFREGMTVKEIAAHLNMNIKAVKKKKYKALVILRSKFGSRHDLLPLVISVLAEGVNILLEESKKM
jgi:RNA polymerase sigma-70 factor (family 1)